MNSFAKKALVEAGVVSKDQIEKAESAGTGISFAKTLIRETGIPEERFFAELSKIYQMPYVNIRSARMDPGAKLACSEICINRWGFFPVQFDPKEGLMTVAVSSPDHAERVERIFKFLMEPYDIGFVFTDEEGLVEALARECHGSRSGYAGIPADSKMSDAPSNEETGQKKKIPITLPKAKAANTDRTSEEKKMHHGSASKGHPVSGHDSFSEDFAKSLVSAVSLLVHAHLVNDAAALSRVKDRVRYCQLTSTRLGLKPVQYTKVALSAWLSALSERRDVIRQFVCTYDLESIIFADESGRGLGIEALILSLVKVYQDFLRASPDEAVDVGLTRRALFMAWPSASKHQDILETFLQVLMDEQFIDKLGRHAGRVIVCPSNGASLPDVSESFERSGYAVQNAGSFDEIESAAQANRTDLLILSAYGACGDVLALCRRIKACQSLAAIPLVVVVADGASAKGAEFLRAGADDFVQEPIDIEILLLKAEKLMAKPMLKEDKSGVSGSLTDMSFCDLVQVLSAGAKSMDVTVTSEDKSGRIVLKEGSVVHAEAGGVVGEQAFYSLMQWKTGQFSMSECREFPEPTVTASTMSLLMEGARVADEAAG